MTTRITATWLLAGALCATACAARRDEPSLVPEPSVDMSEKALETFKEEVEEYVETRKDVRKDAPPLPTEATAEQISSHRVFMARRLQKEWQGKRRGNVFKPEVEAAFRRILKAEFEGPHGPQHIQMVRAGNPRVEGVPDPRNPSREVKTTFPLTVGGIYPDGAPFSSVPPDLLMKLPQLPDQVRYRFVGRALILRDTEANVILDFIPDVVPDPSIPR